MSTAVATPVVPFASLSFEEKLDRFAQVAVHVGLNLQAGQELVISASTEMMPLVRRITEHAYKAGANLVTTAIYTDSVDQPHLDSAASTPRTPPSIVAVKVAGYDGMASALPHQARAARLAPWLGSKTPRCSKGQDPAKRLTRSTSRALQVAYQAEVHRVSSPEIHRQLDDRRPTATQRRGPRPVFPDRPRDRKRSAKLWDAIFAASRATSDDPVAAWKAHSADIHKRVAHLNKKRFHALRFHSDDGLTDLTVGLADDHLWAGGGGASGNGVFCNPNIPTEECFTTPHKDRVDGFVKASKPLSHQGSLIENIQCRFEAGRIVEAKASSGEDVLNRLISTDDGARQLGEVALVPHSSPIAQSGILFWNTLFDENAASHIALGQAYATCLIDGENLDAETLAAKGANASLIHVDWMIGSATMDVDGITQDGWLERAVDAGGRMGLGGAQWTAGAGMKASLLDLSCHLRGDCPVWQSVSAAGA